MVRKIRKLADTILLQTEKLMIRTLSQEAIDSANKNIFNNRIDKIIN